MTDSAPEGRVRKFIPPPPRYGPTDEEFLNGPHREEIAALLAETEEIAKVESLWRRKYDRLVQIWVRLRALGITQHRMAQHYRIDGTPIKHVRISLTFKRFDARVERDRKAAAKQAKEAKTT